MSSYITKAIIGNEFDKVMKGITGDGSVDQATDDTGIFGSDPIAEQQREAAIQKERKERHAKVEKEREEARQKIRDKYNLKKKDEPANSAHRKTTATLNENQTREVRQAPSVENQGFNPTKMATNTFNSLKKTFGWK